MNKIHRVRYKNGARLEVQVYQKKQKDKHDSDRIRLKIVPVGSEVMIIWMHALEAVDLISALSTAVGDAIVDDLPLLARD